MVKLAEKERDSLEVWMPREFLFVDQWSPFLWHFNCSILQAVKNEAESFVLKELTLLKWQEKATVLAHDEASSKVNELQGNLTNMEENLKNER